MTNTIPTLDAIRALDSRNFATLSADELLILRFYHDQGRKFDVAITISTDADAKELEGASRDQAEEILRRANSHVHVAIGANAAPAWAARHNEGDDSTASFSFRAECMADVEAFIRECASQRIGHTLHVELSTAGLPDVEVELKSDASLDTLRNVMRKVVDGQVMLQTLRACPLAANSLERDFDLN